MTGYSKRVCVVIPAFNEENSIGLVLENIPTAFRQHVVVSDNGSTDSTAAVATKLGATVIRSTPKGYGSACLGGIAKAREFHPDIIVFLDADYSDFPEEMSDLVRALEENQWDLVIGSRTTGLAEEGALLPQARFGNWLATRLMAWRYGYRFTDLGPFRAIRMAALESLRMEDLDFGWTMEMQVKALKAGLRVGEIPVRYRKRVGVSKITGTIRGTVLAGYKILWTLGKHSLPVSKQAM